MSFAPIFGLSNYLPAEFQLPEDENRFKEWLADRERLTADVMNVKEDGHYEEMETLTNQNWFTSSTNQQTRQTFRKVFNRGAVTAGTTDTFNHNINGIVLVTRMYGASVTATDFRPLPYVSTTGTSSQVEINCNSTQINVIVGAAHPNISSYIIVLEVLKN